MSGERSVNEKTHAELGASSASRWMPCPGSIRLSRQVPVPPTTSFAQEGTQAHSLAELCLVENHEPEEFIGVQIEGSVITEEMAEYVKVYTDHVRDIIRRCWHDEWWVERPFSLESLDPPAPMFGTPDFIGYERVIRRLHVDDLKYGRGVPVEVKGNKQTRYYALGALLTIDLTTMPVDDIEMAIVQPRAPHPDGPIRTEIITLEELLGFAVELLAAARRTMEPDAPLVPGETQCRFCPAAGVCPAQKEKAMSLAQIEFDVVTPIKPPAVETLPIEWIVENMSNLEILEDWIKSCRSQVSSRLEAGIDVPGYKLVAKRPSRKWTDRSAVEQILKSDGFAPEEILDMDLRSPAQIEKLLGKKGFAAKLGQLVVKESSGHKMVPASDPAPAIVLPRGEEFDVVALIPGADETTNRKVENETTQ